MSDYEIAAIDLDDTLLRSDGTISAQTVSEIICWQAAGRKIVIATGRPPRSIGQVLPIALHAVPWVCYNGAEIRLHNECVYTNHIPQIDTQSILVQLLQTMPQALIGVEIDGDLYLNRTAPRTTPYKVADLLTLRQAAAKILVFSEEKSALPPLTIELPTSAQPLYSARYPHFIQILATNCNKATALQHLVTQMGSSLDQVVAFGDDTNDIEMVAMCGLGVAVANAVDEVKAVANRITATNEEDGVATVLAELLV